MVSLFMKSSQRIAYMQILFQSPGVAVIGFHVLRLSVNLKELGKVFASHLNFQKLLIEEILHQIIDTWMSQEVSKWLVNGL